MSETKGTISGGDTAKVDDSTKKQASRIFQRQPVRFKGTNETLANLYTKSKRRAREQFTVFQKSIAQHSMTDLTNPGDIILAIRDLKDPMSLLMLDLPHRESASEYALVMGSTPTTTSNVGVSDDNGEHGVELNNITSFPTIENPEAAAFRESLHQLYKEETKVFASRCIVFRQNIIKLWGVTWGQYPPALEAELKGDEEYTTKAYTYDVVWLLIVLKLLAAGIDRSVSSYQPIITSLTHFQTLHQQSHETIEAYHMRFESAWNATVMNKASLGNHPNIVKNFTEFDTSTPTIAMVEDKLAAIYFLTFADPNGFSGLWKDLYNATLLGIDEYPLP